MGVETIRKNVKQNDTKTKFFFNVINRSTKAAVPLTGCSAKFQMKIFGGTALKIDSAMVINDEPNGQCNYQFVAGDLDTPGSYNAEIEITFADTTKLRTSDRLIIVVNPEVIVS